MENDYTNNEIANIHQLASVQNRGNEMVKGHKWGAYGDNETNPCKKQRCEEKTCDG
uniref:Uncharacterized protein n=1 Tax=Arion vulgaris TaxID=1028688 RepID=A0A0B6ZYH8_9EUPU